MRKKPDIVAVLFALLIVGVFATGISQAFTAKADPAPPAYLQINGD
jgi:hypothetical protein